MVEVYGHLGLDFTWLDFEHCGGSPSDSDLLEPYTHAADVPVGGVTDDTDDAREKLEERYRLLRVGDEVSSARTVLGERLDSLTG